MPHTQALHASIERFYAQGMTAIDIAESLISFDADTPSGPVRSLMEQREFDDVGVRQDGLVAAYASRESLTGGTCGDHAQTFPRGRVMPDSAPLFVVIPLLDEMPSIFINVLGHVGGIVTREDVQKPPVRMWLFGIITMLEMAFNRLLEFRFPDDGWTDQIAPSRLAKARQLQKDRARTGERVPLAECLQFSDKGQVLFKHPEIRDLFGIPSRARATKMMTNLRGLRDNLAHSGDIVANNWDVVVRLCGVIGIFPKLIQMK